MAAVLDSPQVLEKPLRRRKAKAQRVHSPAVTSGQGVWTYEDYLSLPDDGKRYEIIEGRLYMSNAPSFEHQSVVLEIATAFQNLARARQLGQVIVAPFEVHLSVTSRPVQPDILFVKATRWPKGPVKFFEGAPDLIVEVLSPSTMRLDRYIKFEVYEKIGVPEYWIVDPVAKTVEVYTRKDREYELFGQFLNGDMVQSKILEGLTFAAASIFAGINPD